MAGGLGYRFISKHLLGKEKKGGISDILVQAQDVHPLIRERMIINLVARLIRFPNRIAPRFVLRGRIRSRKKMRTQEVSPVSRRLPEWPRHCRPQIDEAPANRLRK